MICGLSEECECPAQKSIRDAPGKVAHLENGHCLSAIELLISEIRRILGMQYLNIWLL